MRDVGRSFLFGHDWSPGISGKNEVHVYLGNGDEYDRLDCYCVVLEDRSPLSDEPVIFMELQPGMRYKTSDLLKIPQHPDVMSMMRLEYPGWKKASRCLFCDTDITRDGMYIVTAAK